MSHPRELTAVILAGERPGRSPLCAAAGVPCKALVPVGGRPMVQRVVDSVARAACVRDTVLCGPAREVAFGRPGLADLLGREGVRWVPPASSPAASLAAALERLPDDARVLVTTADHALLAPAIVDTFAARAAALDAGVVAGVARIEEVRVRFPELRKTAYRFRDGAWCGCNLYLVRAADGRRAAAFWRRVEAQRKRPWRAARLIGWSFLGRYLTRTLTLAEAARRIGERMGVAAGVVTLPFPEAAVDIDSVADWHAVGRVLASEAGPGPGARAARPA